MESIRGDPRGDRAREQRACPRYLDPPTRRPENHTRLSGELFEPDDPQRLSGSFEIRDLGREPRRKEECRGTEWDLIAPDGWEPR